MAAVAEMQSCSGKEWSRKKEGSLPRRAARAAPIAAAAALRAPGLHLWTAHSPVSRPTLVFPIPLDRQFPSEPRLVSPLDDAEHSMIFNCAEFCWAKADAQTIYNAKVRVNASWEALECCESHCL